MHITRLESYAQSTQVATSLFFVLLYAALPVYFILYHAMFIGYIATEIPIYTPDNIYCAPHCFMRCIGIILVGTITMSLSLLVLYGFRSKVITKCVAYIIGVVTLPGLGLLLYGCMWKWFGDTSKSMVKVVYGASAICFGGMSISLLPPFCRRRAHILAGLFLPGVRVFKLCAKLLVLERSRLVFLPLELSAIYLACMVICSKTKSVIQTTVFEEFIHRLCCVFSSCALRMGVTLSVLDKAFKTADITDKKWFSLRMGSLAMTMAGLSLVFTGLSFYDGRAYRFPLMVILFLFQAILKIGIEWGIPIVILRLRGVFDFASIASGREWFRTNKMHFCYFELCKYFVMSFMIVMPMAITYYVFNNDSRWSTSEISIVLSLIRLLFSYFYTIIDASIIVILIGQKLTLPQKTVKRVTYTDIVHMYRNSHLYSPGSQ
ncbi:hypothetical protein NEDG_00801 [Nematocida displodere]|uniref:Uncharacterized protein n=1 Tax=Nematocida displodere TaxID=1805483 RepID=A0A177ECW9_9MICR|nr:hypothetical protein NEDG_00801 [Nematocida displodere]